MKKIVGICAAVLLWAAVGCESYVYENGPVRELGEGTLNVRVRYGDVKSRSLEDYQEATEEEMNIVRVDVLVFDKTSGRLEMSGTVDGTEQKCSLKVIEGEKIVYAIVNGPDLEGVTTVSELMKVKDDMSLRGMSSDGLMMSGYTTCTVVPGKVIEPEITVMWLAARVVLGRLECGIARQFEKMTLDCVFLGNANVSQTVGGTVGKMVNIDGYADEAKKSPIGVGETKGACPDYLYRSLNKTIEVEKAYEEGCCLYCQPNPGTIHTCLYIRVLIDGNPYYYRVPLHGGLVANHTYSVEAVVTNLGAPEPPMSDMQKGEIVATVSVKGWDPGDDYVAEF